MVVSENNQPVVVLKMSVQEAQVLVNLLDKAVRAEGLSVSQAALSFAARIQAAAKTAKDALEEAQDSEEDVAAPEES